MSFHTKRGVLSSGMLPLLMISAVILQSKPVGSQEVKLISNVALLDASVGCDA